MLLRPIRIYVCILKGRTGSRHPRSHRRANNNGNNNTIKVALQLSIVLASYWSRITTESTLIKSLTRRNLPKNVSTTPVRNDHLRVRLHRKDTPRTELAPSQHKVYDMEAVRSDEGLDHARYLARIKTLATSEGPHAIILVGTQRSARQRLQREGPRVRARVSQPSGARGGVAVAPAEQARGCCRWRRGRRDAPAAAVGGLGLGGAERFPGGDVHGAHRAWERGVSRGRGCGDRRVVREECVPLVVAGSQEREGRASANCSP